MMKCLNVKYALFFLVLYLMGGISSALAETATAENNCTFISPFAMQENLKKKYYARYYKYKEISLYDYLRNIYHNEFELLFNCELSLLYKTNKNKKKRSYLKENLENALTGPDITGGNYIKGDLYLLSQCQHHACIANINSDVFDRQGHLLATILYLYPSPDTSSPQGQQLADMLDGKHKEDYYPLEAWVGIRKDYNTPELRTFIREAFEKLQKGSGATIVAVHGMPKE